jgi:hypothetical protein
MNGIKKHNRYLTGIHLAGGEPFIKPEILIYCIEKAVELGIPLDYVETNAFWCWNDDKTIKIFTQLKDAGLPAVLVSASPFHLEFIPMDRVNRAVSIGKNIFGNNGILIYTNYFYQQFQEIDSRHPLALEDYLQAVGPQRASMAFATEYSLIPNGRVVTNLDYLYEHHSAQHFFGESCRRELSSPHHVHIDLYGNYIAGLCAGISLGNGMDLDSLYNGIDIEKRPLIEKLVQNGVESLYAWAVEEFDYEEKQNGYIAKCHLCLDIRKDLFEKEIDLLELAPRQFYENLD